MSLKAAAAPSQQNAKFFSNLGGSPLPASVSNHNVNIAPVMTNIGAILLNYIGSPENGGFGVPTSGPWGEGTNKGAYSPPKQK